jgi:cyanuric acid amidohydrolase
VALGEVDRSRLTEDNITQDLSIYTRHVQGIAGAEIRRIEVVAMGNRPGAAGHLKIASTHIRDMLDQRSLRALIAAQGLQFDSLGELQDGERIEALIAKMMVSEDGLLRGSRTTVWTSGWAPESHIRAAASGVLGSLLGHLRFFVSADSVHQAPEGGGMAAIVVRC